LLTKFVFTSLLAKTDQKHPVVNFINILLAAFAPILFCQNNSKSNCNYRKAEETTSVQKKVKRKLLMILTLAQPVGQS